MLKGTPAYRASAVLCIAESDQDDVVSTLEAVLEHETSVDIRKLLKCLLFSLGHQEYATEVATCLEEWLEDGVVGLDAGVGVSDVIGRILAGGDRAMLERVVHQAIGNWRRDLYFAVADVVDAFPIRELLAQLGPAPLPDEEGSPEWENESLAAWWRTYSSRLMWDEQKRRYRLAERGARLGSEEEYRLVSHDHRRKAVVMGRQIGTSWMALSEAAMRRLS